MKVKRNAPKVDDMLLMQYILGTILENLPDQGYNWSILSNPAPDGPNRKKEAAT
jgi:hypothetical protein